MFREDAATKTVQWWNAAVTIATAIVTVVPTAEGTATYAAVVAAECEWILYLPSDFREASS